MILSSSSYLSLLLNQLVQSHQPQGPHRAWVLCEGSRGFISLFHSDEPTHLVLRAAAGRSLRRKLSHEDAELLYSLGLKRRTAASPFEAAFPAHSEAERHTLSLLIEQLMERVYLEEGEEPTQSIREAYVPELNDQPLLEAMTLLSRERSHSARQRLYWAFVRSTHLLALEGPPSPKPLGPLTEEGALMSALEGRALTDYSSITGYCSAAVFSTWQGALRCHPEGVSVVEVKGRALLPLLLSRETGSLLINPRGQVGGELYRNELSSMHEAMTQWERQ